MNLDAPPGLVALLAEARDLGFLGPAELGPQIAHARGFGAVLDAAAPPTGPVVDLGAGGGLPSLVLLVDRPTDSFVLVEAMARRAAFLRRAVAALSVADRARVVEERAEVAGHDPELRARGAAVLARGFGPPATTAECAAPLLAVGGVLVVSDPPAAPDRWPADGLAPLGLEPMGGADRPFHYRWFRQTSPCPEAFPRRTGLPRKRPLF